MAGNIDQYVRRIAQFDIVDGVGGVGGRFPSSIVQLAFGVGWTAMVVSTRWMIDLFAPAVGPYALTFPAILLATLFGRWLAGLTTLVSSALLIWFYILPSARPSDSVNQGDGPRFVVDIVLMLVILIFAEIFRRAICEAEDSLAKVEERTRALLVAEAAMMQSQRTEAVGHLTGGLAHGFNNLLAGISGNLELLRLRMGEGRVADSSRYIEAAQAAVKRAASLTQRLLSFSRHQALDPHPTDVDALATGMLELIRRTVGPTISVGVISSHSLWMTMVDPYQLEIALLNLCINARDAMTPHVGRLTIETENIDSGEALDADGFLPRGSYVALRVSDTGIGMSPDLVARAFDPFVTMKPEGHGLGLSMVYGFARQAGGHVRIDSTPGKGTTVHLFLPRFEAPAETVETPTPAPLTTAGGATILVVEDEPTIRDFVVEVLHENGYKTRQTGDGPGAMHILRSDAEIDLLIVDIGLPGGTSGRQVVEAARLERPDIKTLFMTGYAVNVVLNANPLEPAPAAITKPFTVAALVDKVHALLTA